mmetsp:Transcript_57902/g.125739  ORF Transcript_57902/g.125739 Transcript_57902/m.125739 type:complete len:283 (-) Transcript_57902:278-1126(-)
MTLLSAKEAPTHAVRPFILSGYRQMPKQEVALATVMGEGLFSLHNETLNIWTHLLAAVWSLERLVAVARMGPGDTAHGDLSLEAQGLNVLFLCTALFCFFASTFAHLLGPVLPPRSSDWIWQVDLYGICMLVGGCYFPGLCFAFRCLPAWRRFYASIVALGLIAAAVVTSNNASMPVFVWTLAQTCVFCLVPALHWCLVAPSAERAAILPYLITMLLFYTLGFLFWRLAIPERAAPGRYDFSGSHVLWHLSVVFGIGCWERACAQMLHIEWERCVGYAGAGD